MKTGDEVAITVLRDTLCISYIGNLEQNNVNEVVLTHANLIGDSRVYSEIVFNKRYVVSIMVYPPSFEEELPSDEEQQKIINEFVNEI